MSIRVVCAAAGLVVIAGIAACGSTSTQAPEQSPAAAQAQAGALSDTGGDVTITARDFHYEMPGILGAGINRFTLVNAGRSIHEFRFLRLNDGAAMDQVIGAIKTKDRARLAALTQSYGGVYVDAGATNRYAARLHPGSYAVLSVERAPNGIPDVAQGMLARFSVSTTPTSGVDPSSDGTLMMRDSTFDLPPGFGRGTYRVVNAGPSLHEARLFRLAPDKSLADMRAALAGPASKAAGLPAGIEDIFGGLLDLAPGVDAWMTLQLTAGHYAMLSFVDDPATHLPQAAGGMIAGFAIA